MSIRDGFAEHSVMLTVASWSTTPLNLFNVWRNGKIPSTRTIGLSAPPDAVPWTGAARLSIPEVVFFTASSSRAASSVVTSEASSWSVGVSWFNHEYVFGRKLDTTERTLSVSALVPVSDSDSTGNFTTMEGSDVGGLALPSGIQCC